MLQYPHVIQYFKKYSKVNDILNQQDQDDKNNQRLPQLIGFVNDSFDILEGRKWNAVEKQCRTDSNCCLYSLNASFQCVFMFLASILVCVFLRFCKKTWCIIYSIVSFICS